MLINDFIRWSSSCLQHSEEAQSYLLGRGSSEEQWVKHSIGFIPGMFDPDPYGDPDHSKICGDKQKKILWCDTCRFRSWSSTWEEVDGENAPKTQFVGKKILNSVVYPLTSYSGSFVGFQICSIKEKSYDTFVSSRRPEAYFFGMGPNINSIWNSGEICIVEGPSDQLIVERLFHPNTVALLTNSPSQSQMKCIKRFAKKVYLFLDLDKAGRDGTNSFINRYGFDFNVVSVSYGSYSNDLKDARDLWNKLGDEKFRSKLELERMK